MPKSYILAKILFKKRVYGVHWVFAETMEVHTKISSEKNFAAEVQKVRPKIRISQAYSE